MMEMVDINKIDGLLSDFKEYGHKEEKFSEFILNTKDNEIEVFDVVDSVGIVTKADFENDFHKDFVEKNFDDLAHSWFNGLDSQTDFGILIQCVKDDFKSEYDEWREKRTIKQKSS